MTLHSLLAITLQRMIHLKRKDWPRGSPKKLMFPMHLANIPAGDSSVSPFQLKH